MSGQHTRGPWRRGKRYNSVVADEPVPGIPGNDAVQAYGGHMVAESVAPQNIPIVTAAPQLLVVVENLVRWHVRRGGPDDLPLPDEQQDPEIQEALHVIRLATDQGKL